MLEQGAVILLQFIMDVGTTFCLRGQFAAGNVIWLVIFCSLYFVSLLSSATCWCSCKYIIIARHQATRNLVCKQDYVTSEASRVYRVSHESKRATARLLYVQIGVSVEGAMVTACVPQILMLHENRSIPYVCMCCVRS